MEHNANRLKSPRPNGGKQFKATFYLLVGVSACWYWKTPTGLPDSTKFGKHCRKSLFSKKLATFLQKF